MKQVKIIPIEFILAVNRIKYLKELDVIGFEEYLESGEVCFIEWPEIAMSKIVDDYKEIFLKFIDDKTREVTLKQYS